MITVTVRSIGVCCYHYRTGLEYGTNMGQMPIPYLKVSWFISRRQTLKLDPVTKRKITEPVLEFFNSEPVLEFF